MDIGDQSKSDNSFTAKCRLHQSKYRAEKLKEPCGNGPTAKGPRTYGNMLVDGGNSGSNFISDAAFEFARAKVEQKRADKKSQLTIDEYRLFNNMLSSMPMCFNLFSDLRALLKVNQREASRIIKLVFSEINWIDKVTGIDIEYVPTPITKYTNDKSAFDAMILVDTVDCKRGIISIETKYTDLLGKNAASKTERKDELIKNGGFFKEKLVQDLKTNGYKQIHRNFLLTYAFALEDKYDHFANVIISPSEDILSEKEIVELKNNMTLYSDCILKINLQEFVNRGSHCGNSEIEGIMKKFKVRYLDY